MIGMGFLRLNKVLKRHKWTPSKGHEEIEKARAREDVLLTVVVVLFFVGLLAALVLGS